MCEWASFNLLKALIEQKAVFKMGHWSSPTLVLEFMLLALLVLSPSDSDWNYTHIYIHVYPIGSISLENPD
jgi:hypothetical protein